MAEIKVEICCGSADDAIEAKKAGAHRVELNSGMFLGGLTPTVGELILAKKAGIEVMAMVRPREGGFCYTEVEYETMLLDADVLVKAGADGIVFGFLHKDGTIDKDRCKAMMKVIGDKVSVFHRAIDVVPDWKQTLDILIELGVTRVLTSGQSVSAVYGMQTLKEMIEYAAGRIEILPGAGIRISNVEEIVAVTGCNQVHLSMKKTCYDTSTAANSDIHFGGALYPPEDIFYMADKDKISEIVGVLSADV